MLKMLLIIPSSTSKKPITHYSYFILISLPTIAILILFQVRIDI